MKKMLLALTALLCVLFTAVGCTTSSSMTYLFTVDNGDKIVIEMDTTGKYKMTSDVPFVISNDGETLSQGAFIHSDAYSSYVELANSDKVKLIDSGTKNGNEYVFWNYNDEEYNYAILISGCNTGVILGNNVSEESAKECFNRLSISVQD